jgi:hypothetical protein
MLDVRNYEKKQHLKKVFDQYGPKPDAEGGPTV